MTYNNMVKLCVLASILGVSTFLFLDYNYELVGLVKSQETIDREYQEHQERMAQIYMKDAMFYVDLEEWDKAIEKYQYVIDNYPETDAAVRAKRDIDGWIFIRDTKAMLKRMDEK